MKTPSPRWLLGIDGGGTSCRARLTDGRGRLLGEGRAGSANVFSDPDASWRAIELAGSIAYREAGIDPGERRHTAACLGLAGLDPLDPRAPADWPLEMFHSCVVETDALVALRGAFAGEDGAVLVIGTGSVGFAIVGGRRFAVGGYGALVSDEGSGNWLGREAVRQMLWCVDGRQAWSPFTHTLREKLGSSQNTIGWARSATPADFARLAPDVLAAASAGDETATAIVRHGAMLLDGMIARLARSGAKRICLLGGLSISMASWLEFGDIAVTQPRGDALDGAIRLAGQAIGAG
ncbi:MAG: ATPase [Sphingomonadaceae bacterium]|nr:ATPase [Sphingomonadaceae bacterium]